jgi:hypothetical protein
VLDDGFAFTAAGGLAGHFWFRSCALSCADDAPSRRPDLSVADSQIANIKFTISRHVHDG